jgi:hypothetical protein
VALTVAATILLLANRAWADTVPSPAAEVCAPGAMTITRDGPVVYDGVDCKLGPNAAGAAAPSETTVVPSATVLRPAAPPTAAPAAAVSAALDGPSAATMVATVTALFGAVVALYAFTRRRQRALFANGWD